MKFSNLIIFFASIFITQSCNAQTASTISIDGQTFYIESFMPDGSLAGQEYIYFKKGTIEGSECTKFGYNTPSYSMDEKGMITAKMNSKTEGLLTWKGTIENGVFQGKAYWEKEGQDPITMTFEGKKVKK